MNPADPTLGAASPLGRIATALNGMDQILTAMDQGRMRPRPALSTEYARPAAGLETEIAGIWTGILGIQGIGANDNLFELGGNSLLITQISSGIRERFVVLIPAQTILQAPTVAGFAAAVAESAQASRDEASRLLEHVASLPAEMLERELGAMSISEEALRIIDETLDAGMPRPWTEYFAPADVAMFPAGASTMVFARATGTAAVLESDIAEMLHKWHGFAALADQAELAASGLGVSTGEALQLLEGLASQGLLVTPLRFLTGAGRAAASPPQTPIDTFTVVTCNRPDALRACLESYLRNFRDYGRCPRIVIGDDTSDTADEGCQELIREISANFDVPIQRFGRRQKEQMAARIASHSRVPLDIVRTALFDVRDTGLFGSGANRNTLLLAGAGKRLLMVDDDTACHLGAPASLRDGIRNIAAACSDGRDPGNVRAFPDRAAALAGAGRVAAGILDAHERMLGKPVIDCNSMFPAERIDLQESDAAYWRRAADARVAITLNGLAGDCAWGSPSEYLWLTGDSLDRLAASASDYEWMKVSREVVRCVDRHVIAERTDNLISAALAVDQRYLRIPFKPLGRGVDYIFALTAAAVDPNVRFAHLPLTVEHAPAAARRFWPGEVLRSASGTDFAVLLEVLIAGCRPRPGAGQQQAIVDLGAHLRAIADFSAPDFEECARAGCLEWAARRVALLENRVLRYGGGREWWARDIHAYIDALRKHSVARDYWIPLDVQFGRDRREAAALSQKLTGDYGRLLEHWPAIALAAEQIGFAEES